MPDFLKVNEKLSQSDYLKAAQTYSPSRSFKYPDNSRITSSFKSERSESLIKLSNNTSPCSIRSGELNASTQCLPSQTPGKNDCSISPIKNESIYLSKYKNRISIIL